MTPHAPLLPHQHLNCADTNLNGVNRIYAISRASVITNFVLTSDLFSLLRLARSNVFQSRFEGPIKIHYFATHVAEQAVIEKFITQWNTFAASANAYQKTVIDLHESPTATKAQIRETPSRHDVLRLPILTIEPFTVIGERTLFEEYRLLLLKVAIDVQDLHRGGWVRAVNSDATFSEAEVETLNELAMLTLGKSLFSSKEKDVEYYNRHGGGLIDAHLTNAFSGIEGYAEFLSVLSGLPRRILAVRNGLVVPEDEPVVLTVPASIYFNPAAIVTSVAVRDKKAAGVISVKAARAAIKPNPKRAAKSMGVLAKHLAIGKPTAKSTAASKTTVSKIVKTKAVSKVPVKTAATKTTKRK